MIRTEEREKIDGNINRFGVSCNLTAFVYAALIKTVENIVAVGLL